MHFFHIYVKRVEAITQAGHESRFKHLKMKNEIRARNTSDATLRSHSEWENG